MTQPIISIIIPVFNRETLVKESLDSVINQTYPNWECIVVDDGSTDNTWGVLSEYAKKDSRIRIFKREREPKGAPTCRNIGIDLSVGDYFMFLDSDDLLGKKCLEFRVSQTLIHCNFSALVFPTKVFIKEINDSEFFWNKIESSTPDIIRFLNFDMPWDISGPLWKKELKEIISFNEAADSMQDWEMHILAISKGIIYSKIEDYRVDNITFYRKDPNIDSIGSNYYSKQKLLARTPIFRNVIDVVKEQYNDVKVLYALNRLILRMVIKYSEKGLFKEVQSFQNQFIWSIEKNFVIRILLKHFFQKKMKNESTVLIEIILYRVFKRKHLFEAEESFFMHYESLVSDKTF